MSTAIQRRRGTTAEHSTFTGLVGELTVDTTKKTVVVHDGVTVGGTPLVAALSPVISTAIISDTASFNLVNTVATTVNAFGVATAVSVGAGTGKTTINNVLQAPSIDLGHASDTTLTRVSAGTVAVEGVNLLTTATGAALAGSSSQAFAASTLSASGNSTLTGLVAIGTTPIAQIGLRFDKTMSGSIAQWGASIAAKSDSSATSTTYALQIGATTSAAAYTCGDVVGLSILNTTKGAGSAITNHIGIRVDSQTQGTNNYAIVTGTGLVNFGDNVAVTGTIKSSATISVGNATPSASGAGITFPATQSASTDPNTLDDYEEGTWTPVIGGSSGTSGQTYSQQSGYYIKNGGQVTCWFSAILTAKGTITGEVVISGLPFQSNTNQTRNGGSLGLIANLATNWSWLTLQMLFAGTSAYVSGIAAASTGTTNLTTTDISNSTRIEGNLTYYV